jgi:hypothetical protein
MERDEKDGFLESSRDSIPSTVGSTTEYGRGRTTLWKVQESSLYSRRHWRRPDASVPAPFFLDRSIVAELYKFRASAARFPSEQSPLCRFAPTLKIQVLI